MALKISTIPMNRKSDCDSTTNVITRPISLIVIKRFPPRATAFEQSPAPSPYMMALERYSFFINCSKPECSHHNCPTVKLNIPSATASIDKIPLNAGAFFLALAFKGIPGLQQPNRIATGPANLQVGDDPRGLDARPTTRLSNDAIFRIFLKQGPPTDAEMQELTLGLHLYRDIYNTTMKGIASSIPSTWWDQIGRLHLIQSRMQIRKQETHHHGHGPDDDEGYYVPRPKPVRQFHTPFRMFPPSHLGPSSAINAATGNYTAPKIPAKCLSAHRRSAINRYDYRGATWGRLSAVARKLTTYRYCGVQLKKCEEDAEREGRDLKELVDQRGALRNVKYGMMCSIAEGKREKAGWWEVAKVEGWEHIGADAKKLMGTEREGNRGRRMD